MGRSGVEGPELAEVKAILARLQRMSPDDEQEPMALASPIALRPLALSTARTVEEPATPLPLRPAPERTTTPAGVMTALLAGCATAALVLFATRSLWLPGAAPIPTAAVVATPPQIAVAVPAPPIIIAPTPPSLPELRPVAPVAATAPAPVVAAQPAEPLTDIGVMQLAEHLIRAGSVAAGRAELLRIAPHQSADVAWALARAFDPNVVGKIENADARANADEAANWYRKWHALAVGQGLVADSVSIERIIRAMRQ